MCCSTAFCQRHSRIRLSFCGFAASSSHQTGRVLPMSAKASIAASRSALRPALTAYLAALERRPALTKSSTSGILYLLSEIISTQVAGTARKQHASTSRQKGSEYNPSAVLKRYKQALKLAAYGFLIGAPLDHLLYGLLARVFNGRTSTRARIAEVAVANAAILPVQNAVYLAALSVIGGATTARQVWADVRASFLEVMQFTVVVSTLALAFAQHYVPGQALVPFLTVVAASVDTVVNIQAKKRAALEGAKQGGPEERSAGGDSSGEKAE